MEEEVKQDIKMKAKSSIKTINRKAIVSQNTKNSLVNIKQKTTSEQYLEEDDTAQNYAENKIIRNSKNISNKVIDKGIKRGKKSLNKSVDKIGELARKAKRKIKNNKKKKSIKQKGTSIFRDGNNKLNSSNPNSKSPIKIKTKSSIQDNSPIKVNSRESARKNYVVKNIAKGGKKAAKGLVQAIQKIVKAVIKVVKAIVTSINFAIAGVFISVIVVLVMIFTSGASALLNNENGLGFFNIDDDIENDEYITNNSFVLIAQSQVGNVGGQPYWSWYGFDERVSWCACFVSWCAEQCGLIEKGVVPKYASCNEGIKWYKNHSRWADRSGYRPKSRRCNIF